MSEIVIQDNRILFQNVLSLRTGKVWHGGLTGVRRLAEELKKKKAAEKRLKPKLPPKSKSDSSVNLMDAYRVNRCKLTCLGNFRHNFISARF